MGDGSVCEGVAGLGIARRPCGVVEGDCCFAARGGFVLMAVGVDGPGSGALFGTLDGSGAGKVPEAIRFWPVVVTGQGPSNGPSKTALRPLECTAVIKYQA